MATLRHIQEHVNQTCKERGWDKNSVEKVFLLFSEEIGELAKEIRNQIETPRSNIKDKKNLEFEFADVLSYLLELANRFDVDLTKSYFAKHEINKKRSWD